MGFFLFLKCCILAYIIEKELKMLRSISVWQKSPVLIYLPGTNVLRTDITTMKNKNEIWNSLILATQSIWERNCSSHYHVLLKLDCTLPPKWNICGFGWSALNQQISNDDPGRKSPISHLEQGSQKNKKLLHKL